MADEDKSKVYVVPNHGIKRGPSTESMQKCIREEHEAVSVGMNLVLTERDALRELVTKLVRSATTGWETARTLAIAYHGTASEVAADKALAELQELIRD